MIRHRRNVSRTVKIFINIILIVAMVGLLYWSNDYYLSAQNAFNSICKNNLFGSVEPVFKFGEVDAKSDAQTESNRGTIIGQKNGYMIVGKVTKKQLLYKAPYIDIYKIENNYNVFENRLQDIKLGEYKDVDKGDKYTEYQTELMLYFAIKDEKVQSIKVYSNGKIFSTNDIREGLAFVKIQSNKVISYAKRMEDIPNRPNALYTRIDYLDRDDQVIHTQEGKYEEILLQDDLVYAGN